MIYLKSHIWEVDEPGFKPMESDLGNGPLNHWPALLRSGSSVFTSAKYGNMPESLNILCDIGMCSQDL